jgi:hypothetical protein
VRSTCCTSFERTGTQRSKIPLRCYRIGFDLAGVLGSKPRSLLGAFKFPLRFPASQIEECAMTNRPLTGFLLLVLTAGPAGCDGARLPSPTPPSTLPQQTSSPGNPIPAFSVADVTVSGVVFEMTATGRVPIEGVTVANGEGWTGLTDANGSFSFGPVWACPCAAEPRVDAGTTSLWVGKDGYEDPPGQPPSRFSSYAGPGYRDVMINGDTRIDIQLVRR